MKSHKSCSLRRTVLLDEDAQGIEEPIIAPIKTKKMSSIEKEAPDLSFSPTFLSHLMQVETD